MLRITSTKRIFNRKNITNINPTAATRLISSCPLYNVLKENKNDRKPIIIHSNTECTYADVYHKTMKYISYLQNVCNIKSGDKIVSISRHCIESSILPLAAGILNTTFIPLNHVHKRHEFEHIINLVKPDIIFIEPLFNAKNIELPFDCNIPIQSYTEIDTVNDSQYNINNIKTIDYDTSIPSLILATSGTTGMSKMISSKLLNVITEVPSLEYLIFPQIPFKTDTNEYRTLCLSPPYHGPGILAPIFAAYFGKTVVFPFPLTSEIQGIHAAIKSSMKLYFDELKDKRVNHVVGNTMWIYELYNILNNLSEIELAEYISVLSHSLRTFTILGENIPFTLLQNFMKLINDPNIGVRNVYGSTEVGILGESEWISTTEYNKDLEEKFYYFSLPKIDGDIKIKFNENNEIMMKSSFVNKGSFVYVGNAKGTKEQFDDDGYFNVGDECIVNYNENKYRFIQRRKDIIQTFGHIIYPEIIENVLLKNKYILNVIVIGIEYNILYNDENKPNIEEPFAFIQLNDKFYVDLKNGEISEEILKSELFDLCEKELNKEINEIPSQICLIDDIPMSSGVKKNRKALKQHFIQQMMLTK